MDKSKESPSNIPERLQKKTVVGLSWRSLGSRYADRWSRWVESIAAKHRAITQPGPLSSMIFAGRSIAERIIRERWIRSVKFYPTVRLSVRQILGQLSHISDSSFTPIDPVIPGSTRNSRSAAMRHRADGDFEVAQGEGAPCAAGYRPIDRVVVRLNDPDVLQPRQSRIALLHDAISETTRRVIENTQRIEERRALLVARSTSLIFRRMQPSIISPSESERPDDFEMVRQRERRVPPIDVDALTDHVIRQIDQRATAWRERMGKI